MLSCGVGGRLLLFLFCFFYIHICRKTFKFRKVGDSSLDSGLAKPATRGFTPPFKSTTIGTSGSYTPRPGLTPVSGSQSSAAAKSLSDQTVRSRAFTSSRLSLPQSLNQDHPKRAAQSQPEDVATGLSLGHEVEPTGTDKTVKQFGGSVQRSSPPVAFVAPVLSSSSQTRLAMLQLFDPLLISTVIS